MPNHQKTAHQHGRTTGKGCVTDGESLTSMITTVDSSCFSGCFSHTLHRVLRHHRTTHEILHPSYPAVRGMDVSRSKTEELLEGSHRDLPAVVTKDELVEIDLELSATDSMVGTDQPLLQVAHSAVGQRDDRFRALPQLSSLWLCAEDVGIAGFLQAGEHLEIVCVERRAGRDVLCDEGVQRDTFEVRNYRHSKTSGHVAPLLHCDHDKAGLPPLQLAAPPQARLRAPNPGLVNLHFTSQGFARCINHGPSQFVEHHPRGFISDKPQLALEKQGRDATRIRRHQVCRPKPERHRRLRVMKDCPGRQRNLVPAGYSLPALLSHHCVSSLGATPGTRETIRPATKCRDLDRFSSCGQILLAGFFPCEIKLKLTQTCRKGRVGPPLHYQS